MAEIEQMQTDEVDSGLAAIQVFPEEVNYYKERLQLLEKLEAFTNKLDKDDLRELSIFLSKNPAVWGQWQTFATLLESSPQTVRSLTQSNFIGVTTDCLVMNQLVLEFVAAKSDDATLQKIIDILEMDWPDAAVELRQKYNLPWKGYEKFPQTFTSIPKSFQDKAKKKLVDCYPEVDLKSIPEKLNGIALVYLVMDLKPELADMRKLGLVS